MARKTLKITNKRKNYITKKRILINQKKNVLIKVLTLSHFEKEVISLTFKICFIFMKKLLKQRKKIQKIRHMKNGTIANQPHCGIC